MRLKPKEELVIRLLVHGYTIKQIKRILRLYS